MRDTRSGAQAQRTLSELRRAVRRLEKMKNFAPLIPEVRTNFVYAKEEPKEIPDVAGVEGRITVVGGYPKAAGKMKFGASDHLARLLIEVAKYDKEIRAALNFKFDRETLGRVKRYTKKRGIPFGKIDRRKEPKKIAKIEKRSIPWKVKTLFSSANRQIPRIFYETEGWGKEPIFVLLGRDPKEILTILKEIIGGKDE